MKKITLCSLFAVMSCLCSAQGLNLNLYAAYVFDDHVESYYTDNSYWTGSINGGFQGGIGFEYYLQPTYSIELFYQRQNTTAPITYQKDLRSEFQEFDFNTNYIMLGANRHLIAKEGKIDGYAGFMLGVGIIDVENPSNNNSETVTKFSWGGRLGCNIWASERVGIKLQAQLLSVVQGAGGGFFVGTGGAGAGVSTYSTIYQFGLGGGLAFRLGAQNSQE